MFFMSLEAQNRELQIFLEPQKQRNKVENAGKERDILSQILSLDPFLFPRTISCSFFIHFEQFQRLQMRYFTNV